MKVDIYLPEASGKSKKHLMGTSSTSAMSKSASREMLVGMFGASRLLMWVRLRSHSSCQLKLCQTVHFTVIGNCQTELFVLLFSFVTFHV